MIVAVAEIVLLIPVSRSVGVLLPERFGKANFSTGLFYGREGSGFSNLSHVQEWMRPIPALLQGGADFGP